jgi:predicted RNA-binding Zn-ribbon protein involved in translation (DUF1610 family)
MDTCPKCGYTLKPADSASTHECPSCGIVFDKFFAVQERKRQDAARLDAKNREVLAAQERKQQKSDQIEARKRAAKEKAEAQRAKRKRCCLICGYSGEMKTWLGHYNFPQFVAIVGLLFWFIPGVIFIAWAWGKHKCPNCGALAKNAPDTGSQAHVSQVQHAIPSSRVERACPWCAEPSLLQQGFASIAVVTSFSTVGWGERE